MKVRAKRDPRQLCEQCFICREWGWDVCKHYDYSEIELCLPCYVDILEVRQARGVMGKQGVVSESGGIYVTAPDAPGNSPSPLDRAHELALMGQGDLWDS